MKITINTEILKRHNLSFGEFLIMLLGYYNVDIQKSQDNIIKKQLAEKNLFKNTDIILSNNSKDLIAQILMESDDKAINSGIDFDELASQLQQLYPDGIKAGKTYSWRGTVKEVAQKLRTLVVKYDFIFTPKEAINAVKEYLSWFEKPYENMYILKNFILRTKDNTMESMFMSIIENKREENNKV